jgi:modulator of FtsH protease
VQRVLRNTYALLAMTLIFSGAVAAAAVTWQLPAPGLVLTLVGYVGLLFAVHELQNSAWALPVVFALTGFMGYTLGPVLKSLPGRAWRCTNHQLGAGLDGHQFFGTVGLCAGHPQGFQFHGRLFVHGHGGGFDRWVGSHVLGHPRFGIDRVWHRGAVVSGHDFVCKPAKS